VNLRQNYIKGYIMFKKENKYFTNKDENFLKDSDLVIFYNEKPQNLLKNIVVIGNKSEFSKVDIPLSSQKFPLLLARLAYVFDIYDEDLKNNEEFEDFVEILKGVRVKKEIQRHNTTLEEIAGVLYLIDEAKKISIIIGDIDDEEMMNLMSFLKMFESKIGVFSKNDISEYEIDFYDL